MRILFTLGDHEFPQSLVTEKTFKFEPLKCDQDVISNQNWLFILIKHALDYNSFMFHFIKPNG